VEDAQWRVHHLHAKGYQRGANLLVDAPVEANGRIAVVPEKTRIGAVVQFLTAIFPAMRTFNGAEDAPNLIGDILEEVPQDTGRVGMEAFVGVHVEDPLPAAVVQRLVAGGGEVIGPLDTEEAGTELAGDCTGFVLGAGVDDNDFVNHLADRF